MAVEKKLTEKALDAVGEDELLKLDNQLCFSLYVCSKEGSDKDCEFISWDLPVDDKKCEVCGSYMVWKTFRGKKFMKCSNKDCTTTTAKQIIQYLK